MEKPVTDDKNTALTGFGALIKSRLFTASGKNQNKTVDIFPLTSKM